MRAARRYVITGRVHGVGFRVFTEAAALREGLHGWVRNTRAGVEIEAAGEAEALARFEHAIAHGPPRARVERFEVTDLGADTRETGFSVRVTDY